MKSTITIKPDTSKLKETLEVLKLKAMLEGDAMVSCTPCWDTTVVLPTEVVPYADHMMWVWDIEAPCGVNMALVIAKIPHRFPVRQANRLRKGDTLAFDLFASELDHGH